MSMSPRLLRPRATGFDPRSISGLALWLDASSTGDLYTTDAGPVTAVSSPTEISGCVGWWDASDAASITQSGGLVSQWNDKSGSGNHATASGTARPTLTAGGLNGRSVMTFDGSANAMTVAANSAFNSNDLTYFIVFKQTSAANKGVYTKLSATAGTLGFGFVVRSDPQIWMLQKNAGTAQVLTSTANPTTQARVYSVTSSTSAGGYLDGTTAATASGQSADHSLNQAVTIGARASSEYLNGYIAEIIHFNVALSTADRARVEAYLAAKWGISGVHAQATATSDPVGYWRDKSGNNRHATQATAGSRPTVGASSTAGKNAVRNNGTGSVALQVAAWPYTAGNTQFAVFNGSAINQGIAQRGSLNDEPRMAIQTGANGVAALRATRGGSVLTQTHSEAGYALSQWAIGATLFNTSLGRAYRDGVYGTDTTDSQTFSGDQELRLLSLPSNIYGINGGIAEFLYYDRQLSAAEVGRVARYLATRWGITLAPQVSNADAQDWINRVYANGGTVSASTASAVNAFCDAIDAAGIRSLMYRANLFCGTGLNACLVPLYRGPSLGGTQYGNTVDTNVGPFVTGDYNETGASGGLLGNGTSKYLNTGLKADVLASADRHLSVTLDASTLTVARHAIGADNFGAAGNFYWGILSGTSASTVIVRAQSAAVNSSAVAVSGKPQVTLVGNGSAPGYVNGSLAVTGPSGAFTPAALDVYVGGVNRNGTAADLFIGRVQAYSIGAAMTASQAAAYYTAMQTFQTALSRNV